MVIIKYANVPEGTEFVTRSGMKLKNLYELYDAILEMSDEDYNHHVNSSKNDFKNWIFHIVQDNKLAEQLVPLTDKKQILKVIEKRISRSVPKQKKNSKAKVKIFDITKKNDNDTNNDIGNDTNNSISNENDNITSNNYNLAHHNDIIMKRDRLLQRERAKEFMQGFIFGIIAGLIIYRIFFF
ncbi:MAG: hypothetical protein ACMXYG_04735 [Candidatus Woesearchaeota archaeon]